MDLPPLKKVDGPPALEAWHGGRGLESILPSPERRTLPLPADGTLLPADDLSPPPSPGRLSAGGIDDFVLAALRPEMHDRALQRPAAFRAAMEAALAALAAPPDNGRPDGVSARAHALLRDEVRSRDLLDHYRRALLQG